MNIKKKHLATVLFLVIAVVAVRLVAFPAEKSAEAAKIRIAYLPIVEGLPLYTAIEKGYFSVAGLEVEAIKFENPNQIIDAVLAGRVDFALPAASGIAGLADAKNPNHLKIFSLFGSSNAVPGNAILVKNDSAIRSISDLRGKKLGILPGIQWRSIAAYILTRNGLTPNQDTALIELPPSLQTQSLETGQIDALLALEPIPTIIKISGIGREIAVVPTSQYVANPFYGGAGILNVQFAEDHPETTEKVLAIFERAIREINNDPTANRPYLKKYTALEDRFLTDVPVPLLKTYNELTPEDISSMQKFYSILAAAALAQPLDFTKLLYSPSPKK